MKELSADDKSRIDELLSDLTPEEKTYAMSCLKGGDEDKKHEEPDGDEPVAVKVESGDEIPLKGEAMFGDHDDEREE